MLRWTEPPEIPSPEALRNVDDPVVRADLAHRSLRELDMYRQWLVRARAEAIGAAYARGYSYAALGQMWSVGGERVRQMVFQSGDGRSGWELAQDVRPASATPSPLPIGIVHAIRQGDTIAACGIAPVSGLGSDFTATIYQTCDACRERVMADLDTPTVQSRSTKAI